MDARAVPTMEWSIDDVTGAITLTLESLPSDASALSVRKYYAKSYGGNARRDFRFLNIDDPVYETIAVIVLASHLKNNKI